MTTKEWANEYLSSEEGKREIEKWNKDAVQYMMSGNPTKFVDAIVKRYDLNGKEIEEFNKLRYNEK